MLPSSLQKTLHSQLPVRIYVAQLHVISTAFQRLRLKKKKNSINISSHATQKRRATYYLTNIKITRTWPKSMSHQQVTAGASTAELCLAFFCFSVHTYLAPSKIILARPSNQVTPSVVSLLNRIYFIFQVLLLFLSVPLHWHHPICPLRAMFWGKPCCSFLTGKATGAEQHRQPSGGAISNQQPGAARFL